MDNFSHSHFETLVRNWIKPSGLRFVLWSDEQSWMMKFPDAAERMFKMPPTITAHTVQEFVHIVGRHIRSYGSCVEFEEDSKDFVLHVLVTRPEYSTTNNWWCSRIAQTYERRFVEIENGEPTETDVLFHETLVSKIAESGKATNFVLDPSLYMWKQANLFLKPPYRKEYRWCALSGNTMSQMCDNIVKFLEGYNKNFSDTCRHFTCTFTSPYRKMIGFEVDIYVASY
jgi:hypothetical protein